MGKISAISDSFLKNNESFDATSKYNRDNVFDKYIKLKSTFSQYGFDISTEDINTVEESDFSIYFDMPKVMPKKESKDKSYLILVESELIRPDNYFINQHDFFEKIFTWDDTLVDNEKYFKLNFSHDFPISINKSIANRDKLCVLIAGNKIASNKNINELYSHRVNAIRWFEKNQIDSFDLYGVGWDLYKFNGSKLIRALNRAPLLSRFFSKVMKKGFPSYKGTLKDKRATLEKYKFSICYENIKDIPGYITEKIFDCFFAGCVPVYWGADNVQEYIPSNCFIDKRDFSSYEELYQHLINMPDIEYVNYLENIESYLKGPLSKQFTSQYYAERIVSQVLNRKLL